MREDMKVSEWMEWQEFDQKISDKIISRIYNEFDEGQKVAVWDINHIIANETYNVYGEGISDDMYEQMTSEVEMFIIG